MRRPDLRSALDYLRQSFIPFNGKGAGAFHPVVIRPSLRFALVPRPREKRAEGDGQRGDKERLRERIALGPVILGPLGPGLVEGSKFDSNDRNSRKPVGLTGLSATGARTIEDLCSLVRQDKGDYGMWTVTLPPDAAVKLDSMEAGIPRFQDSLRRQFNQKLARSCAAEAKRISRPVPAHWWFVAEPQESGRIHWHFVFRCRSRKGRRWLLGKGALDRLIRRCLKAVTGDVYGCSSAGQVQSLRSDAGRYLSKYLRKSETENAAAVVLCNGWSVNSIPRQWWGCSRSALEFLDTFRFELPSRFVGWLSLQWPGLAAMGRLEARVWEPPAEGAPSMVVGSWLDHHHLVEVVEHLAGLAERAYPSTLNFGFI